MIVSKNSIILLLVATFTSISAVATAKPITLVFRYDDYSSQSPLAFERRLINTLQHYSIPATFAVIPYAGTNMYDDTAPMRHVQLQPEKVALLRTAIASRVVSVAQHGYTHEVIARHGEFGGLAYAQQLDRIRKGKRMLEESLGVPITTFVPPGNAYDNNTLRALERLGFRCMSACQFGDSNADRIKLLPEMGDVRLIRRYVAMARRIPDARPIIVVMLHPYDFTEVDPNKGLISLERFGSELKWLKEQKDVRVATIDQLAADNPWLDGGAFRQNMAYQYGLRYYPRMFMNPAFGVYMTRDAARAARLLFTVLSLLTYLAILVLGIAVARVFSRMPRNRTSRRVAFFTLGIVSLLALVPPMWDLKIEWRGLVVASAIAGVWLGFLLPAHSSRRSAKCGSS